MSDTVVAPWMEANGPDFHFPLFGTSFSVDVVGILGAVIVVVSGWWLAKRTARQEREL